MKNLLNQVINISKNPSVSIILNTHRTKPDNMKDQTLLKNLIKEAETRLLENYDKKLAQILIEKCNELSDSIDHNYNLESLVLFVSEDFADFTRLPVEVENRVIIDNNFATRDLVRALHYETSYFVLALSRDKARLILAHTDKVVEEITEGFPFDNTLYTTDKIKLSSSKGQDNLIEEFFNRIDKNLNEINKENNYPVILATESRNYDNFIKVADKKEMIVGQINKNWDNDEAHNIVPEAWQQMKSYLSERNNERVSELKIAVSTGKFLSDITDIWNAVNQGR
ncbi:MAG: hypothetical protein KIT33_11980 [Candidatus Kapabacteria bacterium]|nr:hypothetical protein [Ignavibacteriota bacterium]MCW5885678.1 hypothetical protein [Candidatus Kapabacteria bacterium]